MVTGGRKDETAQGEKEQVHFTVLHSLKEILILVLMSTEAGVRA